ncbi:hypothetical protein KBC31_01625 [Candidatus Saccharibacteria bacterium]|nr:hypothetical protein [Candidatus Saccharibacteria bacterium]
MCKNDLHTNDDRTRDLKTVFDPIDNSETKDSDLARPSLTVIQPVKMRFSPKIVVITISVAILFVIACGVALNFVIKQFGNSLDSTESKNTSHDLKIPGDVRQNENYIDVGQPIPDDLPKNSPINIKYTHTLRAVCSGHKIKNAATLDSRKNSAKTVIFAQNSSHNNNYYVPIDIDIDVSGDGSAKIGTVSIVACANSDENQICNKQQLVKPVTVKKCLYSRQATKSATSKPGLEEKLAKMLNHYLVVHSVTLFLDIMGLKIIPQQKLLPYLSLLQHRMQHKDSLTS